MRFLRGRLGGERWALVASMQVVGLVRELALVVMVGMVGMLCLLRENRWAVGIEWGVIILYRT